MKIQQRELSERRLPRRPLVMGVDPDSQVIGLAVIDADGELYDCSRLTPQKGAASVVKRVGSLVIQLGEQLELVQPEVVVIERPSRRVGTRRHKGKGAGLATYGWAAGAAWAVAAGHGWPIEGVFAIEADEWTRGVPKRQRALAIAARFPRYRTEKDPGLDGADAVGLALWWLEEGQGMTTIGLAEWTPEDLRAAEPQIGDDGGWAE